VARIVISEFMDERAVAQFAAAHDVLYDPTLVDDASRLVRGERLRAAEHMGDDVAAHGVLLRDPSQRPPFAGCEFAPDPGTSRRAWIDGDGGHHTHQDPVGRRR